LVILVWFINMLGAKLAHADAIADDAWRHISTERVIDRDLMPESCTVHCDATGCIQPTDYRTVFPQY